MVKGPRTGIAIAKRKTFELVNEKRGNQIERILNIINQSTKQKRPVTISSIKATPLSKSELIPFVPIRLVLKMCRL